MFVPPYIYDDLGFLPRKKRKETKVIKKQTLIHGTQSPLNLLGLSIPSVEKVIPWAGERIETTIFDSFGGVSRKITDTTRRPKQTNDLFGFVAPKNTPKPKPKPKAKPKTTVKPKVKPIKRTQKTTKRGKR